jgi:protocatechuate 3,4-dioxygenase, alpha subunit
MELGRTPSQTVGPFFELGLLRSPQHEPVPREAPGVVRIVGRVLDGAGDPVPDALVESWQGEIFTRSGTDTEGRYELVTLNPGGQAPHLELVVFARGLLRHVFTRVYFPDEEADALLASLSDDDRATLVAVPEEDALRFDVQLQGDEQTVFFAV